MMLLEQLTAIPGASSDEGKISEFILKHVAENQSAWKSKPTVLHGDEMQDNVILVFGEPRTAIYAHTDTVGFTVGHRNRLIEIGSPSPREGTRLVGHGRNGLAECVFERKGKPVGTDLEPGTILTYKPNFVETQTTIQSPYLDNRLGVWAALKIAETLENGAIVFGTYEEHGGNSTAPLARLLLEKHGVRQALILDVTWATEDVRIGCGTAISMRDASLPRRSYTNRVLEIASETGIDYQIEIQSSGGSDGTYLQKSEMLIDWCFIGPAQENPHTAEETVSKHDIDCTVKLYEELMRKL